MPVPTYAFGKTSISDDEYYIFRGIGFMTNIEYTYKLFYDVGIGASIFAAFSKHYKIAGIQLHIYFSGALKSNINQPRIN